ncbi:MAG: SGNH/GDSL hydrolase family protein [Deltaproteobacteria bacterium]
MHTLRPTLNRRRFLSLAGMAAATLLALPSLALAHSDRENWVATWGASPQVPGAPLAISGQTLRQVAHVSLGGRTIRVRFSNAFGTTGLPISEAHVAISAGGSSTVPGTDRHLTFGGSPTTTVPAGALVVSDPVRLEVPALGNVTVSIWFPGSVSATTEHSLGVQTTWLSPTGNFAGDSTFPAGSSTTTSWYFLNGIEVAASPTAAALVTLGDSITDGYASTVDANHRWPNFLAARLQARRSTSDVAVVDEGISGNRVLHDFIGPNALARFDRDVLAQSGAAWVIVLEGINDIGLPGAFGLPSQNVSADEIIEGHRQLVVRAHAKGLLIYGGTLTPFEGTAFPGYYSTEGEAKRQAVNKWIRTSGAYDAVIDFDAAVRDPANHARILPAYDCGDHLHPNDAGYKAMADAIDLKLFQGN